MARKGTRQVDRKDPHRCKVVGCLRMNGSGPQAYRIFGRSSLVDCMTPEQPSWAHTQQLPTCARQSPFLAEIANAAFFLIFNPNKQWPQRHIFKGMDYDQLFLQLRPLLASNQLDDLVAAKRTLVAALDTASSEDEERIMALLEGLQGDINALLPDGPWPDDEDDGLPTLDADGTWHNADRLD